MNAKTAFFNVQPVQDALSSLYAHWQPVYKQELLETRSALGRTLAMPAYSPCNLPAFDRSTMDGYALHAADTYGASASLPAFLRCVGSVAMGERPTFVLGPGQCAQIHTGGMLPVGADAVVMIERTQQINDHEIEILAAVAPGENLVREGEDVALGAAILPDGHQLRPQDIGGLLAVGILQVAVVCPPRIGILSSGDELVPPEATPTTGQIRDINASTLSALVHEAGGQAIELGIARDEFTDLLSRARAGYKRCDMLIITAGSSVSSRDMTREVINHLGVPGVLQHGLAVKPGKPTLLAVCDEKPVIGLPGNPASAFLVAQQIVLPIIKRMLGQKPAPLPTIQAILQSNLPSTTGREDRIPVTLTPDNGQWLAQPIFGKSNLIYTLVNADGIIHIPLNSSGLYAGNRGCSRTYMTERKYYLEDIPLDEARQRIENTLREIKRWQVLNAETIPLTTALGRVTAAPVWARISSPHYHAAAMDGYAVRAKNTLTASETRPIHLEIGKAAHPVNTGDPLPEATNAVIMIEQVQHVTDEIIEIRAAVPPWQHVRMLGEDMVATELVLPANHLIRPVDLGAIAGCGHHSIEVRRRPQVVIIPTGSELVAYNQNPNPGQIIEYNSLMLQGQISEGGGVGTIREIIPDSPDTLQEALKKALADQPDMILILSGSSAGSKDFTASAISALGTLVFHGVAVRPGHPVIFGHIRGIPIFGIPGYPVSAALTGEIFIQPILAQWLGLPDPHSSRPQIQAVLSQKLISPMGDDDFVRVALTQIGEQWLASPLQRGAGVITSLVRADGLAHIPRFQEGRDRGENVEVSLYRPLDVLKKTVLAMGSHDPMIDLWGQHLTTRYPGHRLNSAHVGSMGGLLGLRRHEAHLAGVHLLDTETGIYNLSYVHRYLPDTLLQVITFAHREQGLYVASGNPLAIRSIDDLPRTRYVNRQRGAGTRVLLDYELEKRGISPQDIHGYDHEEYTHLAVAAAIASGIADCGMGVRSGAIAMGLDFIPIGWERYDLVIPDEHRLHPTMNYLLEVLNSGMFQADLAQQPGYNTQETGKIQMVVGGTGQMCDEHPES